MSNFTQGPWALLLPHELWVGRPIDDWAITVDDHDTWICTGPTWDEDKSAESAANGRLIAAAPELLAALEALLPYAEHSDMCGDHDAYNGATTKSCGCGLDGLRERANALLSALDAEATP